MHKVLGTGDERAVRPCLAAIARREAGAAERVVTWSRINGADDGHERTPSHEIDISAQLPRTPQFADQVVAGWPGRAGTAACSILRQCSRALIIVMI